MIPLLSLIDRFSRAVLPAFSVLLFVLLSVAPWPFPLFHALAAPLPLIFLCYWVVRKPEAFPVWASFAFGLLHDALSGHFMGLAAFCYLMADIILRAHRTKLLYQSFMPFWLTYSGILVATNAIQWATFSLLAHTALNPVPAAISIAFGVVLFPPVVGLLDRLMQERD